MPIYVYQCQQCGARLERRQRFTDAPLTECEECRGDLRRVLHPVGIIFKGSGFYTTDYARSSGPGGASTNGSSSNGSKEGESASSGATSTSSPSETATTSTPSSS